MLTGEEQKGVCRTATLLASRQFDFDRTLSRCYVADQTISDSEIAPGYYDLTGMAVMNFDGNGGIPESVAANIGIENVLAVAKTTSATASDFLIVGALPQSEEPSSAPSTQPPTISSAPSSSPTSSQPTLTPTTFAPTISHAPTISTEPTSGPTTRKSFKGSFKSLDIGRVALAGQSFEGTRSLQNTPGLYTILAGGSQIYVSCN